MKQKLRKFQKNVVLKEKYSIYARDDGVDGIVNTIGILIGKMGRIMKQEKHGGGGGGLLLNTGLILMLVIDCLLVYQTNNLLDEVRSK